MYQPINVTFKIRLCQGDKMNWEFLFLVLERVGIDCKLINMVQMLFNIYFSQ
jgi:hypothetical protein